MKSLRDAARKPHPGAKWLEAATRYSAPELEGERLRANLLDEEDAAALEKLVRRRRQLATAEPPEALTDDETAAWEQILGKAAGDEGLFERKRRDAKAKAKLADLKDARKVASLQQQPLLPGGSVQLPRYCFRWLTSPEAHQGAWSLADCGVLVAVLGAFANDDPSVFVGGRFEGEGDDRSLVVPGGIGADIQMHGQIAGSAVETGGSGHVRVRRSLGVLKRNHLIELEETVGELRIRLGDAHGS